MTTATNPNAYSPQARTHRYFDHVRRIVEKLDAIREAVESDAASQAHALDAPTWPEIETLEKVIADLDELSRFVPCRGTTVK